MRELLEKWTRLEPDRCYEVEYGDGTATAVTVAGETLYVDSPGRVKADQGVSRAFILAATIEAIEAQRTSRGRGWTWTLRSPRNDEPQYVGLVYYANKQWKAGRGDTPAEALLTAYRAALARVKGGER